MKDVPAQVKSSDLEKHILEYWDQENIFQQSLEQHKNDPLFTFYDGPPYATGKPHYGHILQSAIKDTVLRFKTMQGHYVPRRVGWDTHGLPVENLVEKELGFKTKKDIEAFGIEQFNAKCREVVFRYIDEFTGTLKRIGRWADYDNAYATLDTGYMESEWWVFRQLWDQDLIYKGSRSTPYCIRCATPLSNFELGMNYKDAVDLSVYARVPIVGQEHLSLLVWTTTPWTLPANTAVAFSPEVAYVSVEHEGEELIVAQERLVSVFGQELPVKKTWTAQELQSLRYQPLYEIKTEGFSLEDAYRIVPSAHVTATDGTGLVHIAPAFGEEDAALAKQLNLPVLKTVDTNGNFLEFVPNWGGNNIFASNKPIIKELKERNLLFKQEAYRHSYPFCWRCDTPLIYFALDTWYIRVEQIKDRLGHINEQINWTPKHVKNGRFGKGLESAPDWAVTRNRFWSVPVPLWECDSCAVRVCVGSINELSQLSGKQDIQDIHRPYVDDISWKCADCSGTMKRIEEVLDVWFDSGSMPYAQWHYPFENKELVEQRFPADFIAESIEMTRAWFYVLHVIAGALTAKDIGLGVDKPAYKNVIASGLIFAEDGQKLSKKLKNYPEIDPTLEHYGADVLRFYLLSSASLGEPYRFSEKEIRQLQRNTYMTLWNVYSFFVRYANTHNWKPTDYAPSSATLDVWIMGRLAQLEAEVIEQADAYQIDSAARAFLPFIDDLSNWYVRRSRQRFQRPENDEAMQGSFGTLYEVLRRLSVLLAPFMPFVAEEMYRNLTGKVSVHLESVGAAQALSDEQTALLAEMGVVREVVSLGLAARAEKKIKVRQPLQKLTIKSPSHISQEYLAIIAEEVNVKEVVVDQVGEKDHLAAELDTVLTAELQAEGIARELIRHGQLLRRQAGYMLNDRIQVALITSDPDMRQAIASQQDLIAQALQADDIEMEKSLELYDAQEVIAVEGAEVHIALAKR
jgi:isoleucyl-tRNA synthetase